jgi:hypothetical protein
MLNEMKSNSDFKKIFDESVNSMLPFESWEKLSKESGAAFSAFCMFRDYGTERNLKRALLQSTGEISPGAFEKRYRMWRVWSTKYQWFKRAEDYDRYLDRIKQAQRRKTIEEREAAHRETTGKMLLLANKKLDLMLQAPCELTQGNVKEWVETVINTERDLFGLVEKETDNASGMFAVHFQKNFENL